MVNSVRPQGTQEIVAPPKRYARVDHGMLMDLLGMHDLDEMSAWYRTCVDEENRRRVYRRAPQWTGSLAVGDEGYVDEVKRSLMSRAVGRETHEREEGEFELREPVASYNPVFDPQNSSLSLENSVKWEANS